MCLLLTQGEIVLATIPGARHNPRPVVIVIPAAELLPDEEVYVVGISSDFDAKSPYHFPLPFHSSRHPKTGLKKRCAAKCDWTVRIKLSHVVGQIGRVLPATMLEIVRTLEGMA